MAESNDEDDPGRNINCENFHLGDKIHQHQNHISLTKNVQQNLQQQITQQITYVDRRQITVQQANLQIAASSTQQALPGPHQQTGIEQLTINEGTETPNQPANNDQGASVDVPLNSAIVKVVRSQQRNLQRDVTLHGQLKVNVSNIPLVHPTFVRTDFYGGLILNESEEFVPSTRRNVRRQWMDETVAFNDLLVLVYGKKFTALIGPAGSGKTTTSLRLVQATNDLVPFHLRFMDMNYDGKISARQLLMDYLFPDLDATTKQSAFSWMLNNPEKCVFIMDGYDQAVWSLENVKPVNASYDTPLTIQQLVANLCCKKFFKQSMLIFTSRPHAMISIPSELRPDVTIDIKDLSTENMKKLFYAFVRERSDELWEMLSTKAPQLFDLCHNPILLQFIIIAALHRSPDDLSSITTITGVFGSVLEHLRHSDHARGLDINRLWEPLGRMAYKGMKRKSVVFTTEDLKKEGLVDVDAQDLVIIIARQLGFNQRLLDGDKIIFFIHQLLQEKFAAKYISTYISDEEFNEIIDEVVAGGHWSMVRRFLFGLLLGEKKEERSSLFLKKLLKHVEEKLQSELKGDLAEVFVDLLEVSDVILSEFVKIIPDDVKFGDEFTDSVARFHAFNRVLLKLDKPVGAIVIYFGGTKSDEVVTRFLLASKEEKWKTKKLEIVGLKKVGQEMDSILPHVEISDQIILRMCGINDVSKLSNQIRKRKSKFLQLNLFNNPIGNMGLQHLAHCLCYIHTLKVKGCGITDLQALIAPMLQQQSKTIKLHLGGNEIGNKGMNQLSLFIHKLEWLNVEGCGVTNVTRFCKALKKRDTKMRFLSLAGDTIGLNGAISLCGCLGKIETLRVNVDDLTEKGMDKLESVNHKRPKPKRTNILSCDQRSIPVQWD